MKPLSLRLVLPALLSLFLTGASGLSPARGAEAPDALAGKLGQAWALLEAGDATATTTFIDESLAAIAKDAKAQATEMSGFAPAGAEYDYPMVNAAGILTYVRALAFQRAGKRADWLAGLRAVWTEYPFCQAWDPQGWFWKPGEAAKKEGYIEIITGAVRNRTLTKSPFPDTEDALDYPQMSIALASTASRLLEQGDHADLEYLAAQLQALKVCYPDGTDALSTFFTATGGAAGAEKDESAWELAAERIAAWHEAYPKSPVPQIAEGNRLTRRAWHVRGSGFADTVKPEAWPVFTRTLAEAVKVLEASPRTCPEWYEERLNAAKGLDTPAAEVRALFDEGWKAFPGYRPVLNSMAISLLPRWGGKPGDALRFAGEMETSMPGGVGYATVMDTIWDYERASLLTDPAFDAALYRTSARKLLAAHPGSLSLIHRTLVIALSLKDDALSKTACEMAGKHYHPKYWAKASDYLATRTRVLGK